MLLVQTLMRAERRRGTVGTDSCLATAISETAMLGRRSEDPAAILPTVRQSVPQCCRTECMDPNWYVVLDLANRIA